MPKPAKPPTLTGNEKTGPQRRYGAGGVHTGNAVKPPPPGTYATYRMMRANPTLAIARIAATAPIRSANIVIESEAGITKSQKAMIEKEHNRLWPAFIRDAVRAVEFGWQSWEKVWHVNDAGEIVPRKLKALTPDKTKIDTDDNGGFAGLSQDKVSLSPAESLAFAHDQEPGSYYGRSRYENVREYAWQPWRNLADKLEKYVSKVAGIVPMIEYPPGEAIDGSGATRNTFDIAKAMLRDLGRGDGVAMPNTLAQWAEDLARQGQSIEQLRAWRISFLETRGAHIADMVAGMRHYESLMLRGWFVPERSATEGQYGTKAEAATHADLALSVVDLLLDDILSAWNAYLIDQIVTYNIGSDKVGQIKAVSSGLTDEQKAFFRLLVEKVFTNSANVDLFATMLDVENIIDAAGVPKSRRIKKAIRELENKPAPPKMPTPPTGDDDEGNEDDNGQPSPFAAAFGGVLDRFGDPLRFHR